METPQPSFTHVGTPNDYFDSRQDLLEDYGERTTGIDPSERVKSRKLFLERGALRSFSLLRGPTRWLFTSFPRPPAIPVDLYPVMGFENKLGWVIASQERTGTSGHQSITPPLRFRS